MKKLFTIYDSKVGVYDRPWVAETKGAALRAIMDVLQDKSHPFTKWPADFTLFEIGEWDEQTGKFLPHVTNINCGVLLELVENPKHNPDRSQDLRNVTPIQNNSNNPEESRELRQ